MAKQGTAKVTVNGKDVGELATFEIFDSVEEASAALGGADVLSLVNSGVRTRARNKVAMKYLPVSPEKQIKRITSAALKEKRKLTADERAQVNALLNQMTGEEAA